MIPVDQTKFEVDVRVEDLVRETEQERDAALADLAKEREYRKFDLEMIHSMRANNRAATKRAKQSQAEILRLRKSNKDKDAEIDRLEGEMKSLTEATEPGSWGGKSE